MIQNLPFTVFKNLFISSRLITLGFALASLFVVSYFVPVLFVPVKILALSFALYLILEATLLFSNPALQVSREIPERLSNGDENQIILRFFNPSRFKIKIIILEELPVQFQKRDFNKHLHLAAGAQDSISYDLKPTKRGVYQFGYNHAFVSILLGLVQKRFKSCNPKEVPTYPSFLQLKHYEFLAINNRLHELGVKKIRRVGNNKEFEKIKEYQMGDDYRKINWKASARRGRLMLNEFQDERAQHLYCLIDTGRVMQASFNGMTLLDYSINATLMLSYIGISKYDKCGIGYFNHEKTFWLNADGGKPQLGKIQEHLYHLQTNWKESNFIKMAVEASRNIKQRSLLVLFTNFDTMAALERRLPALISLAKKHRLITVFYHDPELLALTQSPAIEPESAYKKLVAEDLIEKQQIMAEELKKRGINAILTTTGEVNIDVLNKYLELKSSGI